MIIIDSIIIGIAKGLRDFIIKTKRFIGFKGIDAIKMETRIWIKKNYAPSWKKLQRGVS